MPLGLKRYYGSGDLHFITSSCYQRRHWLGSASRRELFLRIMEETRQRYRFVVAGYVLMPEHFHLLISEPQQRNPSVVVQVLKQRFARTVLGKMRRRQRREQKLLWETKEEDIHIWQRRFYDFNVWTERKRIEKLRYMHRNPVKRGLVLEPEQWLWSSFRFYLCGEPGTVRVNDHSVLQLRTTKPAA
jgi:putative transposase